MLTKTNNQVMLTNTSYDVSKKLVQVWIPAFATLYFTLGKIWGFPAIENVVGSLAAIATFLGVVLNVSHSRYEASGAAYDGKAVLWEPADAPGKTVVSLELNETPDPVDIEAKKAISFEVEKRPLAYQEQGNVGNIVMDTDSPES